LLETTVEETKPKEKSRKIKDELQKWKYKTKNGNNQAVVPQETHISPDLTRIERRINLVNNTLVSLLFPLT
jgi:hypothetical protein